MLLHHEHGTGPQSVWRPATGLENLVLGPNEATVRDRYRWADEVSKRSVVG